MDILTAGKINPLIGLDFPDPDVIRVGDTYYMSGTTMYFMPGCEILRSYDLCNWEHAAYVYDRLDSTPAQRLMGTSHIYGKGMWASSLRYHEGIFYLCFSSNDTGKTYLYRAKDVIGPWEKSCIEGFYYDCSLLFDDDGRVYMASGNKRVYLTELKPDLSGPLPGGRQRLLLSEDDNPILGYEGSHFYKINGKYYLFNIHSLKDRWRRVESCFMADSLDGEFIGGDVLNDDMGYLGQGVAQGGIVDTPEGKWYAVLFQDRGAVGRIPVLLPVSWKDDYPVFGEKGIIPKDFETPPGRSGYCYAPLVADDDFKENGSHLDEAEKRRLFGCFSLKSVWQFNHEPDLKYTCLNTEKGEWQIENGKLCKNLTYAQNTITQRMQFPRCAAEVTLLYDSLKDGDFAGLCALQGCYAMVAVTKQEEKPYLVMAEHSEEGSPLAGEKKLTEEKATEEAAERERIAIEGNSIRLKIAADFENGKDEASLFYEKDGEWKQIGNTKKLYFRLDHFTGCRFGLFSYATKETGGRAIFKDFHYQK